MAHRTRNSRGAVVPDLEGLLLLNLLFIRCLVIAHRGMVAA